jgi:hypothetical protein
MLDYRLRLTDLPELAGRRPVQHVVVLGDGHVEAGLIDEGLTFEFTVLICTSRVLPLRGMVALREL